MLLTVPASIRFKRAISARIEQIVRVFPALVPTGSRQSGKTTLLREMFPDDAYAGLDPPALEIEQQIESMLDAIGEPISAVEKQKHATPIAQRNEKRVARQRLRAVDGDSSSGGRWAFVTCPAAPYPTPAARRNME